MNVSFAVKAFRRWWWLTAGVIVAFICFAWIWVSNQTPQYAATAEVFVSSAPGRGTAPDAATAYQLAQLAQDRILTYATIAQSPQVLEPVIAELGLDTTTSELADQVSVTVVPGTVLLEVTVEEPDPDLAAQVANATAASLAATIQELEAPKSGDKSPLKATITTPAEAPSTPVSPRRNAVLILSAFLGALVGVAVSFVVAAIDKGIRSATELEEATRLLVLGTIPVSKDLRNSPGSTADDKVAESLRTIRTNLRFAAVDQQLRSLALVSAYENEGKTTASLQMALSMASAGVQVCLVDLDLRRSRVSEALGLGRGVGVTNVLVGDTTLAEAIVPWQRGKVSIVPAGISAPNPAELLASQELGGLLGELREQFDVVLLDCAPVLPVADGAIAAAAADATILISRYRQSKSHSARRATEALERAGASMLGAILNAVPMNVQGYTGYYSKTD